MHEHVTNASGRPPGRAGMRRSGVVGAMLALSVLGGPRLFEPSTLALAEAVRALGPLGGFRCARSATYVYDPRRDSVDRTLLSEAPGKS